jgi:hypothetical protein
MRSRSKKDFELLQLRDYIVSVGRAFRRRRSRIGNGFRSLLRRRYIRRLRRCGIS